MKTNFSAEYLEKKYGIRGSKDWAKDKKNEFETSTGVKWTFFVAHVQFKFHPCVDFSNPKTCSFKDILKVMNAYEKHGDKKFGMSFLKLVETTGLSFPEVEAVLYHMIKNLGHSPLTGRNSECIGLKMRG